MTWKLWQWVEFKERKKLPQCSGIYIVSDREDFVWYVGQAANLQQRWAGKNHHRYPQFIRSHRQRNYKIYWQAFPALELDQQENYYINLLKPELNGNKVKTYLPKTPQVEREIKRLLKALDRQTMLWPKIRCILAGEYQNSQDRHCFLFIVNLNDIEKMLSKSKRKRYSTKIRQAWEIDTELCGRDPQKYKPCEFLAYNWGNYRFEFIEFTELIRYLELNPEMSDRHLGLCTILSVPIKALKTTKILNIISPETERFKLDWEDKIPLKNGAYLLHRQSVLQTSVNRVYA
jgi:hypothetical protein